MRRGGRFEGLILVLSEGPGVQVGLDLDPEAGGGSEDPEDSPASARGSARLLVGDETEGRRLGYQWWPTLLKRGRRRGGGGVAARPQTQSPQRCYLSVCQRKLALPLLLC